jgi:transcriptional regulator with XRE-family HTH domain
VSNPPQSAGWKFRQIRERLNLTYREVQYASLKIARAKFSPEYLVSISRLADIENNNTVPTIYRMYTLCVVYRVGVREALSWYGVDWSEFQRDIGLYSLSKTHLLPQEIDDRQEVHMPVKLDPGFNPRETSYLSRMIQGWGTFPLGLLHRLDFRNHRYGYIGLDDWMMFPLIMPGALVQIDVERRKVETDGWRNDFERPVYFLETREGFVCSWIMVLKPGQLLLQPYSLSPCRAEIKLMPQEAEIVGRVTGLAMQLAGAAPPTTRAASLPPEDAGRS